MKKWIVLGGFVLLLGACGRNETPNCSQSVARTSAASETSSKRSVVARRISGARATGVEGSARPEAGLAGLRAARAMAMVSFRSYEAFEAQREVVSDKLNNFKAAGYQRYQGDKLVSRFDAFTFWTLSKAMDSQNTGRGRQGVEAALAEIRARALVIGIDSDGLFPPAEQRLIAQHIPGAQFELLSSPYGHDAFLIEVDALKKILGRFLSTPCPACRAEAKFLEKAG